MASAGVASHQIDSKWANQLASKTRLVGGSGRVGVCRPDSAQKNSRALRAVPALRQRRVHPVLRSKQIAG